MVFSAGGTTAQMGAYTFGAGGTLTPLPGSPATDHQGRTAQEVWVDQVDQQVISTEMLSDTFGLYGWQNGRLVLLAHVPAAGALFPTAMTQLGHDLLVTDNSGSSISVCPMRRGMLVCLAPIYLPVVGYPNGIASF